MSIQSIPRFRKRDLTRVLSASWAWDQYSRNGNCSNPLTYRLSGSGTLAPSVGEYQSMTDVVTPGFPRYSGEGNVVFSPMVRHVTRIDEGSGSNPFEIESIASSCSGASAYQQRDRYTYMGVTLGRAYSGFKFLDQFGNHSVPESAVDSSDVNSMILEASTQVQAQRASGQMNLYEDLAQYQQTVGMIGDSLDNIANWTNRNLSILRRAKAAGNIWLLYRYGFMPLIHDVSDLLEGINKKSGKMRVTERSFLSLEGHKAFSKVVNMSNALYAYHVFNTFTKVSVRAMSLDEYWVTRLQNQGLSLKNLMTVPWELIPYSFVADWFVNFGSYLGALIGAPAFGFKQLGSCVVTRTETHVDFSFGGSTPFTGKTIVMSPVGTNVWYHESTQRTIGLPAPALLVKSNFKFLTSFNRIMDALALITQNLKHPRQSRR